MLQPIMKPLSFFKVRPQARKHFDEKELRLLGESLKVRQLNPLISLPEGWLIAGERRYRAATLVGITELEAKIIEDPVTEAEFRRLQLTENLLRQDLTSHAQWQACVELLRLNPNWSQKDLAEQLHVDPSTVFRLLSPSKCIEGVQTALAEDRIGISDCYAISRLSEADQATALAMKLNGATRDQLANLTRQQKKCTMATIRMSRVKCDLNNQLSVTVVGSELGLDEVIEALEAASKEARKARGQNLDVRTFSAVMRDRARNRDE